MFPRDVVSRVMLIAAREVRERGRTRTFRISSAIALVLVVVGILIPSLVSQGAKVYHVGLAGSVVPGTTAALQQQAAAAGKDVEVTTYTVPTGEQAVRDRKIDVLLVNGTQLEWRQQSDTALATLVSNAVQVAGVQARAAELHLSAAEVRALLTPVPVTSTVLGTASGVSQSTQVVGVVTVVLTFFAVSLYGSLVMTGVVQEKSNRVCELLLARMPARELLAGKVIGIGALGLAQFAMVVVAGGITLRASRHADLPHIAAPVLAGLVLWFVLGYALYSVVYAGLGALASRVEDAQAASAPATVVLVVCYVSALFTMDDPTSPVAVTLSLLPPTAPFVMPMRLALGVVPAWQTIVAIVLIIATLWGLIRAAGRVYAGGVLRSGPRLSLRQAWRGSAG